jgi:hypothetical protein
VSDGAVNLNKARKARARDTAQRAADQNAVRLGRTKSEKADTEKNEEKKQKPLDQHRVEDS